MASSASEPAIGLVVGLGNPGPRYAGNRHNVGVMVLDELARRLDAGRPANRFGGVYREARGPAGPLGLLAPQTYMNDSGRSVGPAAGSLHLTPGQVLVIHDEIDLPFGEVRGKRGGGTGGHNGLRAVEQGLGSREFLRVRVGVGRQPPEFRGDEAAWVLANFSEPREEVRALIERAVAARRDRTCARGSTPPSRSTTPARPAPAPGPAPSGAPSPRPRWSPRASTDAAPDDQ